MSKGRAEALGKRSRMRRRADSVHPNRFAFGGGAYTVSESTTVIRERILRELNKRQVVSNRLLQRWAHGRHESTRDYAPLIRGAEKVGKDSVFTFLELIELLTIATFRACGVSAKGVRETYEAAQTKYGDHPFARENYGTDGIGIFTKFDDPEPEEILTHQTFFEGALRSILLDVSYLDGKAATFSPLGDDRLVVLDPKIAFGSPVEKRTGVPTSTLYAMKDSGESLESIADWYGVTVAGVSDALEYEEDLRKAA
jgi:uncharacterized protein (DUF433 family)